MLNVQSCARNIGPHALPIIPTFTFIIKMQNGIHVWIYIHVLNMYPPPPHHHHQAMLVNICPSFIGCALSLPTLILGERIFYYKVSHQFCTRVYLTWLGTGWIGVYVANSKHPLSIIPKVQLRLRVTRKSATALARYPQKLAKIVCG